MAQQPGDDSIRAAIDAEQAPERWWHAAEASLNGIRSNPAYAGLDSDTIAQMARADADALMEAMNDS